MNVMLSLQVLSNAVVVGVVVFVHIWVGEAVPPLRLLLFDIVYGGFALWWALSENCPQFTCPAIGVHAKGRVASIVLADTETPPILRPAARICQA